MYLCGCLGFSIFVVKELIMTIEPLENVEKYYSYYLESRSLFETGKKFKKCSKYLKQFFLHYNLKFPNDNFNRKLQYNEDYFQNIDSEVKAYLLGFIFADGSISVRTRRKTDVSKSFRMNLEASDIEILNLIKKELDYSGEIKTLASIKFIAPNKKEYVRKEQKLFSLSSNVFVNHLENLGIVANKTYKEFKLPDINKDLLRHFIRGYFDGDGCISVTQSNYKSTIYGKYLRVSFTSKLQNVLKEVGDFINLPYSLKYSEDRKVYNLFLNNESAIKFYDFIYNDSNYFLKRKYTKYTNALLKSDKLLENPEEDNQQLITSLND